LILGSNDVQVFSFCVDPERMTVPYPPIQDEIRRSSAFVDLQGRPDKAHEIAEVPERLIEAIDAATALPEAPNLFAVEDWSL
jgi:hypothetical protein